ncbi:unnamed protein product, partial [Discosporangium mesarthrocarpum]
RTLVRGLVFQDCIDAGLSQLIFYRMGLFQSFPPIATLTAVALVGRATAVQTCSPFSARCDLELGVAFGNPWVKASIGEANYFQVNVLDVGTRPSEVIATVAYGAVEVRRCP